MELNSCSSILGFLRKKAQSLPVVDRNEFENLCSHNRIYPFNRISDACIYLLSKNVMTCAEYFEIRNNYEKSNPNLHLFELDNTAFGRLWAEKHVRDLSGGRIKVSGTKHYDSFLSDNNSKIKIEVKGSRAANRGKAKKGNLVEKAARFYGDEPFTMSFNHIKPHKSDVTVFVGVWVNDIRYWVIASKALIGHDNVGQYDSNGYGFHLMMTPTSIQVFDPYCIDKTQLVDAIIRVSQGLSLEHTSYKALTLFDTVEMS